MALDNEGCINLFEECVYPGTARVSSVSCSQTNWCLLIILTEGRIDKMEKDMNYINFLLYERFDFRLYVMIEIVF